MPKYTTKTVDKMLSEWDGAEETDVISVKDIPESKELPTKPTLERHYPSVRDAVVENGYTYQRNEWTTDISFDEEEYPEMFTSSKERDLYAYAQENNLEKDFKTTADELGLPFTYVVKRLGPLSESKL